MPDAQGRVAGEGCLGAALLEGAIDDARHFATLYRYAPLYVEAEDW